MSDPKDIILNAIRVLRSRRVRPSDAKIAWFARREFLQSEETTSEALQELVRCGDIFRVTYKGGTSYRVAPHKVASSNKLIKPSAKKFKFTPTPTDILRPLLSAIAACGNNATKEHIVEELIAANHFHLVERLDTLLQKELRVGLIGRRITPTAPGERNVSSYYITRSAPLALITNKVGDMKNFPPQVTSPKPLQENQKSPVSQTTPKKAPAPFEHLHLHLKRLQQEKESSRGNEATEPTEEDLKPDSPESSPPPNLEEEATEGENKSGATESSLTRRGRPRKPPVTYEDLTSFATKRGRPPKMAATRGGGKAIKRARKVFDPSDASGRRRCATAPSDNGSNTTSTPPNGSTTHCCEVCHQFSAAPNTAEDLLVCYRCSARAHPNCLGYTTQLAEKSRQGPWTCMDCKLCAVCNMDHNIGTLIFCDECDRAYHLTCHHPPLDEQIHGKWICNSCNSPGQNAYDCLPGLPTPRDSPVPDEESRGSVGSWENMVFDPRIPNASLWNVENVIEYFKEKGFHEHANVFRDQDIDGTALLMLTRSDVLTGLDLKLGPALKIYKFVRILQTRLPNPLLP